jgi:hypothetical protein
MNMESHGGMILTGGNRRNRRISPGATLSTTNLIWTDRGANPGLRGERLATNPLSHGMARGGPLDIGTFIQFSCLRRIQISISFLMTWHFGNRWIQIDYYRRTIVMCGE